MSKIRTDYDFGRQIDRAHKLTDHQPTIIRYGSATLPGRRFFSIPGNRLLRAVLCRLAHLTPRRIGRHVSADRLGSLEKGPPRPDPDGSAGIGNASLWVSVTGVAEVAIAIGLQIPDLGRWVAGAAIILLCCLFPANVKAAREGLTILQRPVLPMLPRLLLQLVFIGALAAVASSR